MDNIDPKLAKIKFKGIEVLAKQLVERSSDLLLPINDFHYDVATTSQVNPQLNVVFIKADVRIKEKTSGKDLFFTSIVCGFEIENFHDVIEKKADNFYIIPPELDAMLRSVSVSTSRGLIFSELAGTYLYTALLPIVIFSPAQIPIPEEIKLQKSK
jgi:hypothetical protein